MTHFEITEEQFQELMRVCRLYRREAERCRKTKSYLAACVMIGAALEADLVAMCSCYSDEIPDKLVPKNRKGERKHLLEWSLFQLLRVARECAWLPTRLNLNDDWDARNAHIGDYAVVLKDMRNLVHASRYLKDFPNSRLTKRRMDMCFEILELASNHLEVKLHASLKEAIEAEEKNTRNKPDAHDGL